jgi:hypothetical protein
MLQLAVKHSGADPVLEYGTVIGEGEGGFVVRSAYGEYSARLAVSCLVRPDVTDRVLLSVDAAGDCFILSVLSKGKSSSPNTELTCDGPLCLRVRRGSLSLLADEGVVMATPRGIDMTSDTLHIQTKRADVTCEHLSVLGRFFHSRIREMKIVSGRVETIVNRLTERLTDAFRFVKDHEEIQTGSTRYLVETNLTMHAKNTMQVAEEMVTINAEQINLG